MPPAEQFLRVLELPAAQHQSAATASASLRTPGSLLFSEHSSGRRGAPGDA
jgi:hypothetical protein